MTIVRIKKKRHQGKNGVIFDEKLQKWNASIREDNKTKFLGYYLTYEEARLAREKAEGENEFYKKGDNINFSDVKGRENIIRKKGTGSICQRASGIWRATLIKHGVRVFQTNFKTYAEAEQILNLNAHNYN